MKFAFCVEDESDEAIFVVILQKILGAAVEPDGATTYRFPPGGWRRALDLAPLVARHAARSGFDGALFAIDNDGREEHVEEHANAGDCRHCALRHAANVAEPLSWTRPGMPSLRYFFAVPIQMVETWLLLVRGHPFSGPPEQVGVDATGRRQLKRWLYGDESPSRARILAVAIPIANQLEPTALAAASQSFANLLSTTASGSPRVISP